jgi:hypothetical protein
MPDQVEMRRMLLDFALEQARKVCDVVDESDLDFGRINEHLDVAGTEWHVSVRYWTDDQLLRIDGHPRPPAPDEADHQLPPIIAQLFGASETQTPDGTFAFALPRAWLPDRKE